MNKTTGPNYILVIATLSVYFGLVLTCASPQVLAQTESSIKDGVVTKPVETITVPDTAKLEDFLGQIGLLIESGKIDLDQPLHVRIKTSFDNNDLTQGTLSFTTDSSKPVVLGLVKDFVSALDESRLFSVITNAKKSERITGADLDLKISQDGAFVSANFATDSQQTAEALAKRFRGIFYMVASYRKGYPEAQFYQGAKISFKDNQFFIVTNMPRAALEAYLKSAAARAKA
jgi:hypothetical protein